MPTINHGQIKKNAEFLKNLPDNGSGLNFYSFQKEGREIIASDMYPPLNHPQSINFFFFVCMHQFGFWYGDERGYVEPLFGTVNGKKNKGSDLLWKAAMRAFNEDVECFEPKKLAIIRPHDLARKIFSDDNGPVTFPDFETRFQLTRAYGLWFQKASSKNPQELVRFSNCSKNSLAKFLELMREVPGYNEDELQKKNLLLAMALANRPEKWLEIKDPQNWRPIIDYHLMRLALRQGLVDLDDKEGEQNEARKWTDLTTEASIRQSVYEAMETIIKESGKPMSFVDENYWNGRRYCPEIETPDCQSCLFNSVCKKRIELFQPIRRTTAY
ncbi:MAG: hypothetical protein HYT65_00820 [Candidatus Yanofskybacteria bacterium]|nr:hypothetical protein [Candidatus Yanofskybacteria bacterium]